MLTVPHDSSAIVESQKCEVRPRIGVGFQIPDAGLNRRDPPVLVVLEPRRIVHEHLDQVLVEAVDAADPAAEIPREPARRDVDLDADQARVRLAEGALRVDKVGLPALGELAVLRVAGQVGQAGPLEHEGADLGDVVVGGVVGGAVVDVDVVRGDAGGRVEAEFDRVGERLGLLEERFGLGLLHDKRKYIVRNGQ